MPEAIFLTGQFSVKSLKDNIRVVKYGGIIDSINGATITLRAKTNSINEGMVRLNRIVGDS